jgi:hypothetical protein
MWHSAFIWRSAASRPATPLPRVVRASTLGATATQGLWDPAERHKLDHNRAVGRGVILPRFKASACGRRLPVDVDFPQYQPSPIGDRHIPRTRAPKSNRGIFHHLPARLNRLASSRSRGASGRRCPVRPNHQLSNGPPPLGGKGGPAGPGAIRETGGVGTGQ